MYAPRSGHRLSDANKKGAVRGHVASRAGAGSKASEVVTGEFATGTDRLPPSRTYLSECSCNIGVIRILAMV
jgi:hypothetical protein